METITQPPEPLSPRVVGRARVVMPAAVAGREASAAYDADGTITIGRGPSNDIALKELLVSRRHAEVRRSETGYVVVDLGSSNGTYLNGQQVSRAPLQPGDLLSIGRHQFVFDGDRLHEYLDTGPTSLVVDDLSVTIGRQLLLSKVRFGLAEGSLLGVIGPSGCGKSTLLRAVTGIRPASGGTVRYDGRDLYSHYAELRYRIGMVPQDDVLHRQLTVQRALRFAAALRFADDVPRRERKARVAEVLATLGLTERARQRIDTLSGGQRKRTSVALELLTEPSMLCLDEPTSGLDPALDREVMQELRQLADRGATAVVVTHNVLHLDLCDRVLIMCPGGTMGYFGPPEDVLEFFGAEDYADVFDMITKKPEEWTRRYRESEHYRRYATAGVRVSASVEAKPGEAKPGEAKPGEAKPGEAKPGDGKAGDAKPGDGKAGAAKPEVAASPGSGAGAPTALAATPTANADGTAAQSVTAPLNAGLPSAAPSSAAPATGAPPNAAESAAPAGQAGSVDRDPGPPIVGRARPHTANLRGLPLRNRAVHPAAPVRQYLTLCLRMIRVIVADRGYALFLLGLPVALAVLTHAVPGDYGLSNPPLPLYGRSLEAQRLLVVLVMGAAFLGIAPAIREIVQEATIYRRERAVGLSPGAYLASKITVFALINSLQVVVFVYLALFGRGAPSEYLVIANPTIEVMLAVGLVAVASTILGLVISGLVKTVEQTTPVLVMVVMAELILSGGLFEANGQRVLEQVSWVAQTRWGFAAAASTVDLTHLAPVQDQLWVHTVFAWWRSIAILLGQCVVLAAAARVALTRHEPGRS
ncbi:ATP-binding cassette domain-containing protein [Rugosimonospora africana]|uniref:ATP-binding cassette domain-containing protein n=1 Tax=Rugosimonospora africana TaxID=556532 RepID=UPI0019417985|nr:ATP-binding cassette domain-containing protein [Rugosimonospora africana]